MWRWANDGLIDGDRATEVAGHAYVSHGRFGSVAVALVQFAFLFSNEEKLKAIIQNAGLTVSSRPFIPVAPLMIKPGISKMAP